MDDKKFNLLLKHSNEFLEKHNLRKFDGKLFLIKPQLEIIKPSLKMDYLKKMYSDPKTTANGRDSFYFKIKQNVANISKKDIVDFLKNQTNYQIHYIQPRQKILKPSNDKKINMRWQMDLIDLSKNKSSGHNYILTVIDCFSKFAYIEGLKNKTASAVAEKLELFLNLNKESTGEYPKIIQSDNGSEFISKEVKELLAKKKIRQVFSPPYMPQANGIIERFNGTLKRLIFSNDAKIKYWYDNLPDYIENYNNSYHSTIKDIPANIHKKNKKNIKQIKLIDKKYNEWFKSYKTYPELKIGDSVRIHILTKKENRKNTFAKKYVPQWSKEIYKIDYIEGKRKNLKIPYYFVEGMKRKFYRHDLQKI